MPQTKNSPEYKGKGKNRKGEGPAWKGRLGGEGKGGRGRKRTGKGLGRAKGREEGGELDGDGNVTRN